MEEEIIKMSKKELRRLEVIHKVLEKRMRQKEAAEIISLTVRQVRRIVGKVKTHGDIGIVHGNRGKPSQRKFPDKFKDAVITLLKQKYYDFGPTFASEKLEENDKLEVSKETLRQWMIQQRIWIPKKFRDRQDVHQWRKRKECFGEMVQSDGSIHDWLEGRGPEMVLLGYIDDATSNVFAMFYPSEDTKAAMHSFRLYIEKYGIPQSLYFDRNSIYKTTRQPNLDEELKGEMAKTQFEIVLDILNVQPILAYSAEAKGRIERLFRTFQDRLIKEMRLAGICNIDEANKFLQEYLPKYSSMFCVPPPNPKDLHRQVQPDLDLNWVFAFREKRVITNDFTISWRNRVFLLNKPSIAFKRKTATVLENLNGEIKVWFNSRFLEYKEITKDTLKQLRKRKQIMKATAKKAKTKPYKPAANHPWILQNRALFNSYKIRKFKKVQV